VGEEDTVKLRYLSPLIVVSLLYCGGLSAQTIRGDIRGNIADEHGVALPGVSVGLESEDLLGSLTTITDTDGAFKFLVLPPGVYTATFTLVGFQTQQQPEIRVAIGTTVRLEVTMVEAFSDEILVTSESPLVNTATSTVGFNVSQDFFMDLPIGREYTAVAAITPGVQDDLSGQTFYGSTGAENAYYIDGVNTTEIYAGTKGTTLNFEFIDEVQIKAAAYSAEYGHSTGGYLNVVTKSGGNVYHGDVFGYYESDSLRSDLKDEAAEGGLTGTSKIVSTTKSDYGADLGGYFVKDRLWFFAAYDRVDDRQTKEVLDDYGDVVPGAPYAGDTLPNDTTTDLFAFKLTWRPGANHSLSGSVFGDPSENEGAFGTLASSPAYYLRRRHNDSTDATINYDGVFGQNFVLSARYATHRQRWRQEGPGEDLTGFSDRSDPFGTGVVARGWDDKISGWSTTWEEDYRRQQYNADVTWFAGDFAGSHELKLGAEYEDLFVSDTWTRTGPYGTTVQRWLCSSRQYCGENNEHEYYYRHLFWIAEEIDPYQATVDDVLKTRFVEAPTDKFAVYLRDRWQPVPNLTLNLGVRWSRQKLYNTNGYVQMDVDDQWAPRLGFVWDFLGNGKSKLFGNWGYNFESIPMQLVINAFSGYEWTVTTSNFSDDPSDIAQPPPGEAPRGYREFGATTSGGFVRVDPNTRGQYISEAVLGIEYEVAPDVALGLRFIRRNLDRIIEDALVSDHDFMIGNPGEGLLTDTWDFAYWYTSYGLIDPCPDGTLDCHQHEMPQARRDFTGIELTVHKRFSSNWQALASIMWSRLEGSYDGNFEASTWSLGPNWNSAYDYADFSVNNNGLLSNDRPWQLKLDGIYRFDFGLSTGLSTYYRSGTPMTAMGFMDLYSNWVYYLSERGAFGRSDSEWEADIHLGYPIKLGRGLQLNLMLDIFNVFNRQGETMRDTIYTDWYEEPGYQPLDWTTGVPFDPIEPGDVDRPPTYSGWNETLFWQDPRTIRLGVRLSF
jgi:hypothetical protein